MVDHDWLCISLSGNAFFDVAVDSLKTEDEKDALDEKTALFHSSHPQPTPRYPHEPYARHLAATQADLEVVWKDELHSCQRTPRTHPSQVMYRVGNTLPRQEASLFPLDYIPKPGIQSGTVAHSGSNHVVYFSAEGLLSDAKFDHGFVELQPATAMIDLKSYVFSVPC